MKIRGLLLYVFLKPKPLLVDSRGWNSSGGEWRVPWSCLHTVDASEILRENHCGMSKETM